MPLLASIATALLHSLPPEAAHHAALRLLAAELGPAPSLALRPALAGRLWGLDFPSPVGLAAGFDKDAMALAGLFRLGFGFVEAGTVTPRPQAGNPAPRLFRLAEDQALINRMGFNSAGFDGFARNLGRFRARPAAATRLVGINLGVNRDSADPAADYRQGVERLGPLADYLVVNLSSPNTPGLRALQEGAARDRVLAALLAARAALDTPPPLLLKIAPDLDDAALGEIGQAALDAGLDGLVLCNTTTARPAGLRSRQRRQAGGLSGAPLRPRALEALRVVYRHTEGRLPLIGVGGIASAADAYARIRAGASLVQLYTGFVYRGPGLLAELAQGLAARLEADGFKTIAEAVGADHKG